MLRYVEMHDKRNDEKNKSVIFLGLKNVNKNFDLNIDW